MIMLPGFDKIKNMLTKKNMLIIFCAGIVLMIFANFTTSKTSQNASSNVTLNDDTSYKKNEIEIKLKKILSNIDGAGKVEVMIVFDSDYERVVAKNTKSSVKGEKTSGEERQTDTETVMSKDGNSQTPYLLKEINPSVRGVLVIAEGAGSDSVKMNIKNAVKTVLGVSMHKVEVMTKKHGG